MTELRGFANVTEEPPLPSSGDATGVDTLHLLSALLILSRPSLIVEAGTFKGHFAIAAASACPSAHIWTADVARHPEWLEVAAQFGLASRIHFYEGDFAAMLSEHFQLRSVDFAYIDSGPARGHTVRDDIRWQHYLAAKPYMCRHGIVATHDTNAAAQWRHGEDIVADASLVLCGDLGLALWQAP